MYVCMYVCVYLRASEPGWVCVIDRATVEGPIYLTTKLLCRNST